MTEATLVRRGRRRWADVVAERPMLLERVWHAALALAAGALAGTMLSRGGLLSFAAVGGTCVLLGLTVHRFGPSVLPLAAVAVGAVPALLALPLSVAVGGKSLFLGDMLLPVAAVVALCRPTRVPRLDLGAWAYVIVVAGQAAAGLVHGQPFNAFTQDMRGPVYLACGYFVASRLFDPAHVRRYLVTAGVILWYSAGLMIFTILTGTELLAGRTEDVQAFSSGGKDVIDATRFIVESKGLAFIALVGGVTVLLSSASNAAARRAALLLAAPALVVTFLNYARATVLALAVCVALLMALKALVGVDRRRLAATGLVLAGLVGAIGLSGTSHLISDPEGSVLARQVAGFEERVLGGLTTEAVETPGNTYRLLENRYALEAIAKNPVFGHGIGAAFKPATFGDPSLRAFEEDPQFGMRFIHNGWLWYLVKLGAVGLVAFLLLLLAPAFAAVRTASAAPGHHPVDVALAVSLVGLLVIHVFEPDLHRIGTAPIAGAVAGYLALRSVGATRSSRAAADQRGRT